MKYVNCFTFGLMAVVMLSCQRWPTVVLGNSSGSLRYDRNARILEIIWENHFEAIDTISVIHTATNFQK